MVLTKGAELDRTIKDAKGMSGRVALANSRARIRLIVCERSLMNKPMDVIRRNSNGFVSVPFCSC